MSAEDDEKREVFAIVPVERDGKRRAQPTKIGEASEMPDGQIAVTLFALPTDGKLFVRAKVRK